jgi:hypothetical protein
MESYALPASRDILLKKEVAHLVGHTATHASQVHCAINANLDIFGMERFVRVAASPTAKLAKRQINVTNVCLATT